MQKKKRKRLMPLDSRTSILQAFGKRLKQLRVEKGLSLNQLELKSGIDCANYDKYERGYREPGLFLIVMMAQALDMSHSELLNFKIEVENKVQLKR
jgi:transcriptional regulator with XRE-family HTH domain